MLKSAAFKTETPETESPEEALIAKGTRARSKAQNRRKILASATDLFRERGYEAATLRDIARGANLSTGALFANFNDKNEIFFTIIEQEVHRIIAGMNDSVDLDAHLLERLHKQIMYGYEAIEADARMIMSALVITWSLNDDVSAEVARLSNLVRDSLHKTLKDAVVRKELPETADTLSVAEMLEDLCFANLRRSFYEGQPTDTYGRKARFNLEIILKGLLA